MRSSPSTHVSSSQPKAFNFSINHELDEFMAAEKPLMQSRKRTRPRDISTLTAGEQELELEYALVDRIIRYPFTFTSVHRFATYDYTKPQRDISGNPDIPSQPAALATMQNSRNSPLSLPPYTETT